MKPEIYLPTKQLPRIKGVPYTSREMIEYFIAKEDHAMWGTMVTPVYPQEVLKYEVKQPVVKSGMRRNWSIGNILRYVMP